MRSELGQTSVEYAGVLILTVAAVVALIGSALGPALRGAVESQICGVLEQAGCGVTPPVQATPPPAPAADEAEHGMWEHVGGFLGGAAAQSGEVLRGLVQTGLWIWRTAVSAEQQRENAALLRAVLADPAAALRLVLEDAVAPVGAELDNGRPGAALGRGTVQVAGVLFGSRGLAALRHLRGLSLADDLPRGFAGAGAFTRFGGALHRGLRAAGYDDVLPILQGSSVTGRSFRTGLPFDGGRELSDLDVALASPSLFQRAVDVGVPTRGGGTRTAPLRSAQLRRLGLADLQQSMSGRAGRRVAFMIYARAEDAIARSPSLPVPPP